MESLPPLGSNQETLDESDAIWLQEHLETVEVDGKQIKLIDIEPADKKTDIPVVLAPGYGTFSPLHNKANIEEMTKLKRRTLFVDEPRGISAEETGLEDFQIEKYLLDQTTALIGALEAKGVEKVDVVAHSEGCLYAIVAAALYPDKFRELVLFDPGGLTGEDSGAKLIYRFIREGAAMLKDSLLKRRENEEASPEAKQQVRVGQKGLQKYLKSDPARSLEEIKSMAKQQMREMIKEARQRGVLISIVHGVGDNVFPMDRMQEELKRTDEEKELGDDLVDGFYSVKGRHGNFISKPAQWTAIADEALTALENKANKKQL